MARPSQYAEVKIHNNGYRGLRPQAATMPSTNNKRARPGWRVDTWFRTRGEVVVPSLRSANHGTLRSAGQGTL